MYNECVTTEIGRAQKGSCGLNGLLVIRKKGKEALPLIQVIAGKKGSGKTKRIIDIANLATKDSRHDIVFIDDDNRYMFDLRHEVRFINASEYDLANDQMFMGLLCGVVAQNFDIGLICIDAFKKDSNLEHLIDAANYLMFRFKYPMPGDHFTPTDSSGSVGTVGTPINMER
jgi:hypothetical protein